MRYAPILMLLLAAACKPAAEPANGSTAVVNAAPAAEPAAPALSSTGSRLSGSVVALSGSVTGFSVRTGDLGTIVDLSADVLFDFDKATLRADATPALDKAAAAIRAGAPGSIAVTGYTDAKGDDDYNQDLSSERAQAVTTALLTRPGIDAHVFEVRGKGEADPVAPNAQPDGSDDPVGRAKNRRVEIVIPKG